MSWFSKTVRPSGRPAGLCPLAARCLLALGLLLALGTPGVQAQAPGPQYIVQSGDTLSDIARQFGIALEALEAANPDVDPAALRIGRALLIPGIQGVSGTLSTTAVEPGETLDSLALRFDLKRDTLIRLNHIMNPERLYINQSFILVDPVDGGAPVPNGTTHAAEPGVTWLSLAAEANQNPWALAALNRQARPGTPLPAEGVVIPGGEQPTRALPYPLLTLQAHPLPVQQGRTVSFQLITAPASGAVTVTASLGAWPLHFMADATAGTYYALLGIDRLAEADLYPLVITTTETATGREARFAQPLGVRSGNYTGEALTVNPETVDPAVTVPELAQVQALVMPVTPERLWNGVFLKPSVGGITSRFGTLRAYNGGPFNDFHRGIDFSGGEDRPITAPAAGVVIFTGQLTVRGNATIIDHGWGVYTGYWHQSVIKVQTGQRVEPGEVIGYQGGTGRVTGPHLHWEIWVGGYVVDPLPWTTEVFP
jgi:murein DD-endopeptidase MepM/ murein hydrolase activator NlpD